jgi:hypothetical protein
MPASRRHGRPGRTLAPPPASKRISQNLGCRRAGTNFWMAYGAGDPPSLLVTAVRRPISCGWLQPPVPVGGSGGSSSSLEASSVWRRTAYPPLEGDNTRAPARNRHLGGDNVVGPGPLALEEAPDLGHRRTANSPPRRMFKARYLPLFLSLPPSSLAIAGAHTVDATRRGARLPT